MITFEVREALDCLLGVAILARLLVGLVLDLRVHLLDGVELLRHRRDVVPLDFHTVLDDVKRLPHLVRARREDLRERDGDASMA